MDAIHEILFNMHIFYSLALGIWAVAIATRNQEISGNYIGAVLIYAGLAGVTLIVGIIMLAMGLQPRSSRVVVYVLYMLWLTVIMPGLFSLMRGRDDRTAAMAYAVLGFFNFSTSLSMIQRELVMPWVDAP